VKISKCRNRLFDLSNKYVFEVLGIHGRLKNLAKSESGFEDVSRLIFANLRAIVVFILVP